MGSIKEAKRHLSRSLKNDRGFQGIGIRDNQLIVYAQLDAPFLNRLADTYEGYAIRVEKMDAIRAY